MTTASPSTRRLALLLAGLSMFGPFSIDTIFPAFPLLARELAVDEVAVQQTVSVYLLFYGLMSLAHGPLSDAWGRKRVILGGLVLFVAASVGCALSTHLGTLLVFRALQGVSAGVGMIVGRAVIRDLYHGPDAQRLMSQVSMIFGIAPAIAPIIGGWILLGGGDWPLIFWFLVVFSLLLLAATARWLPETHPAQARTALSPRGLLRDYLRIGFNPRFLRLSLAGSVNFGGIFLYIASAPVFVMQHLRLGEGGFAWLFIPTIGGMTTGAFLSGRMAGRTLPVRQIGIGFACCALSAVLNIAYAASVEQLQLPWAVLPIFLGGLGTALIFPVLALAVLDMYPQQRGLASSLQAFVQLMISTVVAGVISPLLSGRPLHLALGMAGFMLLGFAFWYWEHRGERHLAGPHMHI
ncbi:MAG: multidrug effflux MFS transporter [Stenotrophomonas nitritireducens]|uniref:multidrug effflux MFS transporter n=1 Tax=Stenotrophomonas nitritireducens TaxID=83617 RepID=UPI001ACAE35F|nr:multidrug effflux MFS transporter [Stenotrophomonas nitritireducens]MBN8769508.1 multidrug effflux MFS transporter [Stenotrophomonas sp.]MBN8794020.1 multidrug effflux MFS transporter [Stenotrophomonas nitritireducens]